MSLSRRIQRAFLHGSVAFLIVPLLFECSSRCVSKNHDLGMRSYPPTAMDGIRNDRTPAMVSLKFAPGPDGDVWLVVSDLVRSKSKQARCYLIGKGNGGYLYTGHLTGGHTTEAFVFVDGQKTSAEIVRFNGTKMSVLYRLGEGRPYVYLGFKDNYRKADVIEWWTTRQLGVDTDPRFSKHKYALRILGWNGTKYALKKLMPFDGEKTTLKGVEWWPL